MQFSMRGEVPVTQKMSRFMNDDHFSAPSLTGLSITEISEVQPDQVEPLPLSSPPTDQILLLTTDSSPDIKPSATLIPIEYETPATLENAFTPSSPSDSPDRPTAKNVDDVQKGEEDAIATPAEYVPKNEHHNHSPPPSVVIDFRKIYRSQTSNSSPTHAYPTSITEDELFYVDHGPGEVFDSRLIPYSDKLTRLKFIRKVYMLLSVQLLVTFLIMIPFRMTDGLKQFISANLFAPFILLLLAIAVLLILLCFNEVRRQYPCNYLLLSLFTILMALIVTTSTIYIESQIVLMAAGVTFIVFVALSLFSWLSCIDFTYYNSMMFVVLLTFSFFSFIYIFFPKTPILEIIWGVIGVTIFSFYIIIDTQMIIGNQQLALSQEEYILAVIKLYIDVINLFLYILKILSARTSK